MVFGNLFKFVFCCDFFSYFKYSLLYQKKKNLRQNKSESYKIDELRSDN